MDDYNSYKLVPFQTSAHWGYWMKLVWLILISGWCCDKQVTRQVLQPAAVFPDYNTHVLRLWTAFHRVPTSIILFFSIHLFVITPWGQQSNFISKPNTVFFSVIVQPLFHKHMISTACACNTIPLKWQFLFNLFRSHQKAILFSAARGVLIEARYSAAEADLLVCVLTPVEHAISLCSVAVTAIPFHQHKCLTNTHSQSIEGGKTRLQKTGCEWLFGLRSWIVATFIAPFGIS